MYNYELEKQAEKAYDQRKINQRLLNWSEDHIYMSLALHDCFSSQMVPPLYPFFTCIIKGDVFFAVMQKAPGFDHLDCLGNPKLASSLSL